MLTSGSSSNSVAESVGLSEMLPVLPMVDTTGTPPGGICVKGMVGVRPRRAFVAAVIAFVAAPISEVSSTASRDGGGVGRVVVFVPVSPISFIRRATSAGSAPCVRAYVTSPVSSFSIASSAAVSAGAG